MNDFLVLVITKNLFAYQNIRGFFEEEEAINFIDTLNNVPADAIVLNVLAADLVIYMDTWDWASGYLFQRVSNKIGTSYFECTDVEEVKELIAEKFVEWSEGNE